MLPIGNISTAIGNTKPVFLIDADDVLANFVKATIRIISRVIGRPWTLAEAPQDDWDMFTVFTAEQMHEIDAAIDTPGWCLSLDPCPESQEAVEVLRQLCDLYAVTAPRVHAPQWAYERGVWLRTHHHFQHHEVVSTSAKHICSGLFFLDDHPYNVRGWQKWHPEGIGMLWSTEHNQRLQGHDDIRVHSWDEVIDFVRSRVRAA